jgi:antitoxin HicB
MSDNDYPFNIRKLTEEEGSGYLIEYPDLPGCMSDGETIIEVIENGRDAVQAWLIAAKEAGRDIPEPQQIELQSGKWVQRVPKSLHAKLVRQARREGVSLNTLVVSMLAEATGNRNFNHHPQ